MPDANASGWITPDFDTLEGRCVWNGSMTAVLRRMVVDQAPVFVGLGETAGRCSFREIRTPEPYRQPLRFVVDEEDNLVTGEIVFPAHLAPGQKVSVIALFADREGGVPMLCAKLRDALAMSGDRGVTLDVGVLTACHGRPRLGLHPWGGL